MSKHNGSAVWFGVAMTFVLAIVAVSPASAKAVINPQAGATWSSFSFDDDIEVEEEARVGYAIGGNARFGSRLFVAPGIYWQETGFEATAVDDVTLEDVTDAVGVSSIYVPITVGYFLSPASAGNDPAATGLRLYAGPSFTFVTGVGDNAFGVESDDLESTLVGGVLGAGFDLTRITFDVNYDIGFSGVFADVPEGANAKQHVLRGLIGMKF